MPAANGDTLRLSSAHPGGLLKPLPPLKIELNGTNGSKLDAGLRSLDHYRTRLPLWRYLPRQWLIPVVRWETPRLAAMQKAVRSPALDTYFSITANLGTHMFFMIFLPILFWCGYTDHGRGVVHILASGVFFSGFIKDMWCIPRPLSPPLHRITMSHSAALEYGFPSTHSTNAVSVAVYALIMLQSPDSTLRNEVKVSLQVLFCTYAFSIVLGRLYCGMHGFFDVVVGSGLGVLLSIIQCAYGVSLDGFLYNGTLEAPLIIMLVILVLIRIHPEPADDCPCFDDSVAFAGVIIGIELGNWHFSRSAYSWNDPAPATVPYTLDVIGWPRTIARVLVGVLAILAWKEITKPLLLRILPPFFRIIERAGLSLPRRFFIRATEYNKVPHQSDGDNLIPSVSELPSMLTSMRHPRQSRSVSIGPQSEADAYETMAYREKRRRESKSERGSSATRALGNGRDNGSYFAMSTSNSTSRRPTEGLTMNLGISKPGLSQAIYEAESAVYTPLTPGEGVSDTSRDSSQERRQIEQESREMFSKLQKPRVRYDVEVVTKLIVYAGIAWIAVEGGPVLFENIGLGAGIRPG